jgi:hypothetical protein
MSEPPFEAISLDTIPTYISSTAPPVASPIALYTQHTSSLPEPRGGLLTTSHAAPVSVVEVDKNGQHVKKKIFYGRFGNGTRPITDPVER